MNIVETSPDNYPQVFNLIKRIDPRDIRVIEKFLSSELDQDKNLNAKRCHIEHDGEIVAAMKVVDLAHAPQSSKVVAIYGDEGFRDPKVFVEMYKFLGGDSIVNQRRIGFSAYEDEEWKIKALQELGMKEKNRLWKSFLTSKSSFIPDEDLLESVSKKFDIIPFSMIDSNKDFYQKFYKLQMEIIRSIPADFHHDEMPLDKFIQFHKNSNADHNLCLLALSEEGEWAGLVTMQKVKDRGSIFLTGVAEKFRGNGLAYCLKYTSSKKAFEMGCSVIETYNDAVNIPMLRLNRKLNYRKEIGKILFEREW